LGIAGGAVDLRGIPKLLDQQKRVDVPFVDAGHGQIAPPHNREQLIESTSGAGLSPQPESTELPVEWEGKEPTTG
jgi:hypothetical protein